MQDWKLGDLNKSKAYISPILGLNKDGTLSGFKFSDFYDNPSDLVAKNFLNCFMGDDDANIEDKVLMLYKFSGKLEFIEFEERLQDHPLYTGQYDPDKSHVMYVFDVPDLIKLDFSLIKNGQYSKVSDFYKSHVLSFLNHDKLTESTIKDVFDRNERAYLLSEKKYECTIPRNMEALNKPVRKQEYYQADYKEKESLISNIDL